MYIVNVYLGMLNSVIPLLLFVSLAFSQEPEKNDSTFIILKSGEIKHVNHLFANFATNPPLEFKIEFFDRDSTVYDISEIKRVEGEIVMSENTISILWFFRTILQTLISVSFLYFLIT